MRNTSENEIFLLSFDKLELNTRLFRLWINGFLPSEAMDYIQSTLEEKRPASASPSSKTTPYTYGIASPTLETTAKEERGISKRESASATLPKVLQSYRFPTSSSPTTYTPSETTQIAALKIKEQQVIDFPQEKLNAFLITYISQQYHTMEQLESLLVSPIVFLYDTRVEMDLALKFSIIQSYYELHTGFLQQIIRTNKPLNLKAFRIHSLAHSVGLRVAAVHRQLDNIKRVFNRYCNASTFNDSTIGITPDIWTTKDESSNPIVAYYKQLGPPLCRCYFRVCWILYHKINMFPKRFGFVSWKQLQLVIDTLLTHLDIQYLETPVAIVECCKGIREMLKKKRLIEDLRNKLSLTIRATQGNANSAVRFSRYTDNQRSMHRLRSFVDFMLCFYSSEMLSKIFTHISDIVDRSSGGYEFVEALRHALMESLSSASLRTYANKCCDIIQRIIKILQTSPADEIIIEDDPWMWPTK